MYTKYLFDLDGTLIDTSVGVAKALKKVFEILDISYSDSIIEKFIGPPMEESFVKYFDLDYNNALEKANLFRNIYKETLYSACIYEGILDLLGTLKSKGFSLAVATSKSHENALRILNHFDMIKYFDYIQGADLNGKLSKTNIMEICMKQLNANQNNCVMIGDSIADSVGSKNLNIDFLAVLYGFGFKGDDDFNNIYYKKCFKNIKELKYFLLR
ncbi:HAD-IA family hydrolase [Campylobacter lari]|nr:HAD-IA family hydrolase [Campylobacter lari]MCR2081008.1 HAD-IA family hydrolase [Campylobacter lari subsp. concheus]